MLHIIFNGEIPLRTSSVSTDQQLLIRYNQQHLTPPLFKYYTPQLLMDTGKFYLINQVLRQHCQDGIIPDIHHFLDQLQAQNLVEIRFAKMSDIYQALHRSFGLSCSYETFRRQW